MDFIPINQYFNIYFQFLLIVTVITFFFCQSLGMKQKENIKLLNALGVFTALSVLLYMGLRPINGVFTDMTTYANKYSRMQYEYENVADDLGFSWFMYLSSKFISVNSFFLLCTIIYIVPLLILVKRWFHDYWFIAFLMIIGSFSFWSYGVNGIRNGVATSLFLYAISFKRNTWILLFLFLSISFHKAMILPALAWGLTYINNSPKYYIMAWAIAIPLSLLLGSFWENFFATLGFFEDDRLSYLTAQVDSSRFSNTGFRWDFVLYSFTGVFAGYYTVVKKGYHDVIYNRLLNVYLLSNLFWILVIRANFSNRFAYLSWFMLALVIIYPFLKVKMINSQYKIIGLIVLVYYLFTYILNVI